MKNPVYIDTQNFPVAQKYFVDSLTLPSDFPLHRHSFVELEYIYGGKGSNIINGVEYPLSSGTASLLLPWHVHELKSDKADPLRIYKCSFRTDFLAGGNELMGHVSRILLEFKDYQLVTTLDEASRDSFESVFQLALKEKRNNANYKDAFMSALISELVILFLRCSHPTERVEFCVWDVARRIQLEYANPALSGEEVAQDFGYGLTQLNRKLKEEIGLTFFEMLQEARVRSACYLLIYTDMDVEDIAKMTGHKSRSGMYLSFERLKGMSPAAFREKNKQTNRRAETLLYSMTYTKLLYYLHKHFAENVTLDQVAKEFHYNKSYLCQLLAKDNTTFHDMVNEIRIYNACKLLGVTQKTVEVIAGEVGFGSVNAFYENFKKHRGCTPGEYREKHVKIDNLGLNPPDTTNV